MLDRILFGPSLVARKNLQTRSQTVNKSRRRPLVEVLEGRQMLTASLGNLTNITAPAQIGYQVPLDGSGNTNGVQHYSVTSSNPAIAASIAQGSFWTLNVQHTASSVPGDISFAGPLTFQLFNDLTPNTVQQITNFTNDGWYNGKDFTRIANNFPGTTDYIAQGGAANPDGTGTTPYPNFADEFVQQLAFTNGGQLAMANAGANTNNTQFFVTTAAPTFLDYKHTVFGQLVAGANILGQMTQVSKQANPALGGEVSQPVSPIVINSAVMSSANVNGVVHIDTSRARVGDTATITVTATDPIDGSTTTDTFLVTVGAYTGPSNPPVNFAPFANPVTANTSQNAPVTIKLNGRSGYPNTQTPSTLTYALVTQPQHGTVSQFNASTGTFVYTPTSSFLGTDSFQYQTFASGPNSSPSNIPSLPSTVSVTVGSATTGAVRLIDDVLVVTPKPRYDRGTDVIQVTQQADDAVSGGQKIVVIVNGLPDAIQPAASNLSQIVVFGTKANTRISVDPNVTVPATLNGGRGGRNRVAAGGGDTLVQGWFGRNLLIGGTGSNSLVGRKGHVKFRPSTATYRIYAGNANPRLSAAHPTPAGGTYFRFRHNRMTAMDV